MTSTQVRAAGIRAVGLFALRDRTAALVHTPLLVQAMTVDATAVRVMAARALCDVLLLWGVCDEVMMMMVCVLRLMSVCV